MGANPKSKGMRGEYQAARLLQQVKDEVAEQYGKLALSTRIERNLEQTRGGGYDLVGTFDFAVEVKFREQLDLGNWWLQTVSQCPDGMIPILMYKKANVPFRVRMFTYALMENTRIRVLSDMDLESFLTIFRYHCIEKFKGM